MGKLVLLAAVGFVALAPSLARAQTGYPQPCCQDTLKLFWHGFDVWAQPAPYKPYVPAPIKYSPPQPCCQDTLKLFWHGFDNWGQPYPQKR